MSESRVQASKVRARWSVGMIAPLLTVVLLLASACGTSPASTGLFAIGPDGLTTTSENPAPATEATSRLERGEDTVRFEVLTRIGGGHAYTLWVMIFNAPENCDGECGEDDVFVDPANHFPDPENPAAGFRVDRIEAAQISVVWGGGAVADADGGWELEATLRDGQPPTGPAQVVLGTQEEGAIMPISPVTGLTNAEGAEFLLLIQDHGPAHDDPELRQQQVSMFLGACNPEPADPTVFPPDPGSCREVQFAVHNR